MFSPILAVVILLCVLYGIHDGNVAMRETREGKRPAAKKISSRYSYAIFFWLDM